MKKKFFLSELHLDNKYNGNVANEYTEIALKENGYRSLHFRFHTKNNLFVKFVRLFQILVWAVALPRNSVILFHLPIIPTASKLLLKLLRRRKLYSVGLIHDINGLRFNDSKELEEEVNVFKHFQVLIVHNQVMKDYIQKYYPKKDLRILWLFDYYCDNKNFAEQAFQKKLTIAGNLQKAGYIHELNQWIQKHPDFKIDIYGEIPTAFASLTPNENIVYEGAVKPEILPTLIQDGFGIVWDGETLTSCSGNYGNYLRYNTPHKLSAYLAAGIPVIVWKQSAMAEWILENRLGLAVENWKEAAEKIRSLSQQEYKQMQANALDIGNKLRNGLYLKKVLNEIN